MRTRADGLLARAILVTALSVTAVVFGQVIENPAKPAAKNAGRILQLTEVWRITDDGGEFFFKNPRNLQVADDGSIFLAEDEQFLKFSPDGKFLKNLYKKGQGPGELESDFQYYVYGKDLFILDFHSRRLWRADQGETFQEQVRLENKNYGDFLGVLPEGYLLSRTVMPPPNERTGKLMEILPTVALVDWDGREEKDICTFRPRSFLGHQMGMFWDYSIKTLSPDGKILFAYHGRDYLIELVDLAAARVVKRFRRQYPKVPYIEKEWEPEFRKKYGTPKIEFETDVTRLYPVGEILWVVTSTDDKAKGRLIDIFDKDGRFLDSFYLGAGRTLMAVREDSIFCLEKNEDESLTIAKHRIEK